MSVSNYLLDSNILLALLGEDLSVSRKLDSDVLVFTSPIAVGELYYAASHLAPRVVLSVIGELVLQLKVISCGRKTSERYATIRKQVDSLDPTDGGNFTENDIWIAATAIERGLILVTRDSHFKLVDQLQVENWLEG